MSTVNIKKTMQAPLAFIKEHGNLSQANLDRFITEFCVTKTSTSSTPREATILRDAEGNQLGRKCTVTGLWFDNSHFAKNTTCIKPADAVRVKRYHESKAMEKDAQVLLEEAKDITDVMEKVAKYEEYDAKLSEAKEYRLQPIEVTDEMKQGGFNSIDDLAESLNVPVITAAPKKED